MDTPPVTRQLPSFGWLVFDIFLTHGEHHPVRALVLSILNFLETIMTRTFAICAFVFVMATLGIPTIFLVLNTVQATVPGATASASLVTGMCLTTVGFCGVTTLTILRRL